MPNDNIAAAGFRPIGPFLYHRPDFTFIGRIIHK